MKSPECRKSTFQPKINFSAFYSCFFSIRYSVITLALPTPRSKLPSMVTKVDLQHLGTLTELKSPSVVPKINFSAFNQPITNRVFHNQPINKFNALGSLAYPLWTIVESTACHFVENPLIGND